MADVFSLLLTNDQTQLMHQSLVALQRAWHLVDRQKTSALPAVIERSVAIVLQLEQFTTDIKIKRSLLQLRQQLELNPTSRVASLSNPNKVLNALLSTLGVSINASQTPWLASEPQAPLPDSLQSMGSDWHQAIKNSKDHPTQRLQLAVKLLPYRTAFTEAAIAARAILQKTPTQSEQVLPLLYWLAAIHSFLSIPAGTLSGDKVAAAISGKEILELTVNYAELGTDHLSLLSVTDKNRLHKIWGPPLKHQRLGELNPQARKKYIKRLKP